MPLSRAASPPCRRSIWSSWARAQTSCPPARDIGPEGSGLAARIPGATFANIAPGWHFSFLGLCNPGAEAMLEAEDEDPICSDPAGVDRAAFHAKAIADIAAALGL